jgi:E3 ubiquitin-protein ligase TRIP12
VSVGLEAAALNRRDDLSAEQKRERIAALTCDGAPLEALALDFTMPGGVGLELKEGGASIAVTPFNVMEYVDLVFECALGWSVSAQIGAMRAGIDDVFSSASLGIFTPRELEVMLRGETEEWTRDVLMSALNADHGYRMESSQVLWLVDALLDMDAGTRRKFMQFVTGSPTLPLGGIRGMKPKMTVVRKDVEGCGRADDVLVSVMTCSNYIKLPPYSTKEVLTQRLLFAIDEGQHSFHLS